MLAPYSCLFLAEFVEAEIIDTATADERELTFCPLTNGCGEGGLGAFQLFAQNRGTKNASFTMQPDNTMRTTQKPGMTKT